MNSNELTEIGTIKRAHGLKGELKIVIDSFYTESIEQLDAVFLKKGDDYLPFFIESLTLNSNPAILKLESINTKEDATELNGSAIYVANQNLPEIKEDLMSLLQDMQLYDQNDELIGAILEVTELPHQLLLKVDYNDNEVILPFHDDLLIELNEEENKIQINIPEGLLNL